TSRASWTQTASPPCASRGSGRGDGADARAGARGGDGGGGIAAWSESGAPRAPDARSRRARGDRVRALPAAPGLVHGGRARPEARIRGPDLLGEAGAAL